MTSALVLFTLTAGTAPAQFAPVPVQIVRGPLTVVATGPVTIVRPPPGPPAGPPPGQYYAGPQNGNGYPAVGECVEPQGYPNGNGGGYDGNGGTYPVDYRNGNGRNLGLGFQSNGRDVGLQFQSRGGCGPGGCGPGGYSVPRFAPQYYTPAPRYHPPPRTFPRNDVQLRFDFSRRQSRRGGLIGRILARRDDRRFGGFRGSPSLGLSFSQRSYGGGCSG